MHALIISFFSGRVQRMSKKIITTVTSLPESRVEIKAVIPYEIITTYQEAALKKLGETVKIDGFRPGHIPESVLREKVGSLGLLAEMADLALTDRYSEIILESKSQPIGRPDITLSKLAPENDVEFVITSDVMPTVKISNVKKSAEKHNVEKTDVTVTDEELEQAIKEIRQMRAHDKMHEEGIEHHDHNHQNIPDDQLPELDDAFIKTFGDFASVEDFTAKFKENLLKEKERSVKEKKQIALIEEIISEGTFEIPVSMINFELDRMIEQFKHDLAMSGMKIDEYLGHIGKTLEDIRSEWKEQAKKRVQTQLSLEKIAEEFSITPDQEKINEQVTQLKEMYQNQVDESNIIAYVTQMMTNTAVFDWLDAQK